MSPSTERELEAVQLRSALGTVTSTSLQSSPRLPQRTKHSRSGEAGERTQPYLGLGKHFPPPGQRRACCWRLPKGSFDPQHLYFLFTPLADRSSQGSGR